MCGDDMKIAIITHYYNSKNYGGNLQAYALCKVLNNMGLDAEQLSFDRYAGRKRTYHVMGAIRFLTRAITKVQTHSIKHDLKRRNESIGSFNKDWIPHSAKIYDNSTISQCVDNYDVFITGSDQVWHPVAYCPAYGLEFVPSNKVKLSYAASIASDVISEEYQTILKRSLADFVGISVREHSAAVLLRDVVSTPVRVTLDPTLLLSREEWDDVCGDYNYKESYLFCCFLGKSIEHRKLAEEYAKLHGLKIVTLPHLLGDYRKCDKQFGDDKLYDVSPQEFISLIKGCAAVFTDSFHATVFSAIYEKEFVVFDRSISGSMGSRLRSLMEELSMEERFCNTADRMSMQYITTLPPICFEKTKISIEQLKADSLRYLQNCIFGNNYERKSD